MRVKPAASVAAVLVFGLCGTGATAADLGVSKVIDDPLMLADGMDLRTFTIQVTNNDAAAATALVTDSLPAGMVIPAGLAALPSQGVYEPATGEWSVGQLAANGTASLEIPVVAQPSAPQCLTNTATASILDAGVSDDEPDNNSASVIVGTPDCAELRLEVETFSYRRTYLGDPLFFAEITLLVTNDGPAIARDVRLRGNIASPGYSDVRYGGCNGIMAPVNIDCTITELAVGSTGRFFYEYVNPFSGKFTWDVNVAHSGGDPDAATDVAQGTWRFRRAATEEADSGGCFIATAAYGSPLAARLDGLRRFRDRYLLTQAPGRWAVRRYYQWSPPVARFIAERPALRGAVRALLRPAVIVASHPLLTLVLMLMGLATLWPVWTGSRRPQSLSA